MAKKYSIKFWIVFWMASVIFLASWFFYWETRNQGMGSVVSGGLDFLPLEASRKQEYKTVSALADYFLKKDGQEKTVLVLFQNSMEIRPGGGFIGAFGVLKFKDGQVISLETHDLSNFDGRIPDTVEPPYPMKETLRIKSWKLRDSNWSPDFAVNAKKAEEFYYMGQGQEKFDAVIGITANMLTSMLRATGPIEIEGFPGTYDSENAIISLEYQVEKAFEEQGIDRGDRKNVMNDLAREIEKRIFSLSAVQKLELAKIILEDLEQKDIQLYFEDAEMQETVEKAGWAGRADAGWKKDYLMAVDANLGAFKSDYYVKRSLDYAVDLSRDVPTARLRITYEHTAKQRDWMTKDYLTYLRVYVPEGAWLTGEQNFADAKFGNELGRKYFGAIVKVPLDSTKTVEISYALPKDIAENYDLLIQKQAGLNGTPVAVHVIGKDGYEKDYSYAMNGDIVLGY